MGVLERKEGRSVLATELIDVLKTFMIPKVKNNIVVQLHRTENKVQARIWYVVIKCTAQKPSVKGPTFQVHTRTRKFKETT